MRIAPSIALATAALSFGVVPSSIAQPSLNWPVTVPFITQDYSCYNCYVNEPNQFHSGIDIKDATESCTASGPDVIAAAGGTVYRTVDGCAPGSDTCGPYGNHVVIAHSSFSTYALYAHLRVLDSLIVPDAPVAAGQVLGIMGATGEVSGCHVHFALVDFPPGPSGHFTNLPAGSGIDAYTPAHPATSCGAGSCLDPKGGLSHQEVRIGGAASYIVTETPFTGSDCVANVESGQSFVSIAQTGGSYFIHLPSWEGPGADTGGTGACQSESTFGWVNPAVGSPTGPFEVEVLGPAVGSGWLNVRLEPDPQGEILTRAWPGQRFWGTGQTSASTPSECDELWWEIYTPKSRTGGHARGWLCGDYLLVGNSCPVPLGNGRYQMVLGGCGGGEPPVVTTTPASGVTQQTASLNMQVTPGGLTTNAWFRWGLSPSVPNVTSTINVGAGTSTVAVGQTVGGLDCDTTYFFQAWAENAEGQDSGQVLSFDTGSCGGGGTDPVDLIQNGDFLDNDDHWTLIGDFYADRRFNTYNFEPGYAYLSEFNGSAGNNLLGVIYQEVTIPSSAESALLRYWVSISTSESGGAPAKDFLNATLQDEDGNFLAGLEILSNQDSSGGVYFQRIFNLENFLGETIRIHFLGTTDSSAPTVFRIDNMSLVAEVASGGPPEVATEPADQVCHESVRLNMTVDPNGLPTEVWFDLEADDSTPNDDTVHLSIGSGAGPQLVSLNVFDLDCDTLYYFRARASNDQGSDQGTVLSFSTADCPGSPPHADTDPVDNLTSSSARLRAEVNPSGASTQAWFEWGETTALGTLTPQQSVGSGTSDVLITSTINGLNCDTTYYYNAFASNGHGTDEGAIHSFTTLECPPPPPAVATLPADEIAQSSARLNGTITPNGSATTAWFEWGLSPTLGSFTPPEPIGAGGSGVPVSSTIAGLACETTYYFRARAENGGGGASGATLSLVTPMCVSLEADFIAAPLSGVVPLEVQFTDISSGEPTAWLWHFGDGTSSTEQHPIHVYEEPGIYTVRLQIERGLASAVAVQNALIEATTSPVSLLPSFIDFATQAGGAVDIGHIIGAEPDDRITSNAVSMDLNRDGLRDLVLASTRSDPLGRSNAGSVFVIWDVASQAMPIDLADPTLIMTKVIGRLPDDRLGISLHVADVNGDSYPDILVGSSSADAPDIVDAGVVYIVYSSADMASVPLLDLAAAPGSEPLQVTRIYGQYDGNSVGGELAAGDVNADGVMDAILGMPSSWAVGRQQAGFVAVLFGGDYIDTIREANIGPPFGYYLIWGAHAFDVTGSSIATGDVDGDGIDDLAFGAANSDTPNGAVSGRGYIVYGGEHVVSGSGIDLADLPSGDEPATLILGRAEVNFLGWDVDVADLDGDGRQEVLFSAVFGDYPGRMDAGEVNVVWGSEGLRSVEQIDLLANPTGVTRIIGGQAGDWLGYSFATGDISGDGLADLALGAPGPIPQVVGQEPGRVYVVYGTSSLKALSLFDVAIPAAGVKLTRIVGPESQDEFASIITLGSIASDPRVEILASAPVSDPSGRMNAGEVFSVGTTEGVLFVDGFEAGDVSAWSSAVGVP